MRAERKARASSLSVCVEHAKRLGTGSSRSHSHSIDKHLLKVVAEQRAASAPERTSIYIHAHCAVQCSFTFFLGRARIAFEI